MLLRVALRGNVSDTYDYEPGLWVLIYSKLRSKTCRYSLKYTSKNLISNFCIQFQLRLGFTDVFSAYQRVEIFAWILLDYEKRDFK